MAYKPINEPIYYRNEHWAVTGTGLESITHETLCGYKDGSMGYEAYALEAENLNSTITHLGSKDGLKYYLDPLHVAAKGWTDIGEFNAAFAVALIIHQKRYKGKPDADILARTIKEAIQYQAHNKAVHAEYEKLSPQSENENRFRVHDFKMWAEAEAIVAKRDGAYSSIYV